MTSKLNYKSTRLLTSYYKYPRNQYVSQSSYITDGENNYISTLVIDNLTKEQKIRIRELIREVIDLYEKITLMESYLSQGRIIITNDETSVDIRSGKKLFVKVEYD